MPRARRVVIAATAAVLVASLAYAPAAPEDEAAAPPPYGFACNPSYIEQDLDGDGSKTPQDCDDTDPNVHPGAQEVCNLIDDNCNGQIDEFTSRTTTFAAIGRKDRSPEQYIFSSSGDVSDHHSMLVELGAGDEAAGLLMADLDLDGINDVVVQSLDEGWVSANSPDCDGGFIRRILFDTVSHFRVRGAGDVDDDGDVDLVTLNVNSWIGHVWNNDGEGNFEQHPTQVDWSIIGESMQDAALAESQVLLDVTDDGFDDWMMCMGRYGKTYCYVAEGRPDGSLTSPTHLVTVTSIEANSATLGYFTQDEVPDLIFGLHHVPPEHSTSGDHECRVYKLDGVTGGGFESSPDFLFDLAVEVTGTAWGYDPDGVLDGWLRTIDMDRSDGGRSELLILLHAFHETEDGYSLMYVKEPLDVDPTEGVQHKEIRPLLKELVDWTTSSDPHLHGVIAGGFPVE